MGALLLVGEHMWDVLGCLFLQGEIVVENSEDGAIGGAQDLGQVMDVNTFVSAHSPAANLHISVSPCTSWSATS